MGWPATSEPSTRPSAATKKARAMEGTKAATTARPRPSTRMEEVG